MSGIKITFAYDSNGVRVNADSYGAFPIAHPLTCPDKNCEAFLEHVNGYKRESYGKQQFIPAFYRLEKGFDHSEYCSYKSSGRATIVAGESDHEVKDALAKGDFLFRVHVMDAEERKKLKDKSGTFQQFPPNDTTERKYRNRGRRSTYVRTMNSLLEIYNHGRLNPQDRAKIKLIIGGKVVKWTEFFYSTNHLGSLKSRLHREGIVQAAVVVKINVVGLPNQKLGGFRFIECSPKTTGLGRHIYTTLKLAKGLPNNSFTLNQSVMVLGKFSIPDPNDRVTPTYLGNEIRTLVTHTQQVVEI
ncbi:hypothetical protein [Vibrio rotiferianus]|uniref:hypothetical protein n=1 Tax=Vibrio rotiferianus TaxID=190895 RepID=UPI000577F612|nr:hypothetical protein [Vibrio rotiferianus]PIB17087.1 hypothetical protein B853_06652 [Vibrio rotiferianus CAIM 577 = LMG 21460]HCG9126115.1 hypothetical protein [Vibrio parahaemolyticus]